MAVVALGGGRQRAGDAVDPRVGLADVVPRWHRVAAGDPLAVVHANRLADAEATAKALVAAFRIGDREPLHVPHAVIE
jgi:thymidine phosphorylase